MSPSVAKGGGLVGLARSVPCKRDGVVFARGVLCEVRYGNSRGEAHVATKNGGYVIRPASCLAEVRDVPLAGWMRQRHEVIWNGYKEGVAPQEKKIKERFSGEINGNFGCG